MNPSKQSDSRLNPSAWLLPSLLLFLLPLTVTAEEQVGVASIIDGDTLEIHGQRIRLHGVDAPEARQTCLNGAGKPWRCGQKAALALADRVGRRTVRCEGQKKDRYKRLIAVCYRGSEDLNAWLVSEGFAVVYRKYSMDYLDEEEVAQRAGKGVWQGMFDMPWDWRKGKHRVP